MLKISTSILSSDNRQASIEKLNQTNTDYIHIDVMDGLFVPNTQFKIDEINSLIAKSKKKIDIHLMVEDPEYYLNNLLHNDNIEYITIHIEIAKNISYLINKIKSSGYKVGLSIKPKTDISLLDSYIKDIDLLLIMSVEPGFGGQLFIDNTATKIKEIKNKRQDLIIEVDGGINNITVNKIKDTANIAVVGSYIINSKNYQEAINNLKN